MQYLERLYSDLADEDAIDVSAAVQADRFQDRNDAVSCELGIRYPVLQSIMSGRNHQTIKVFLVN